MFLFYFLEGDHRNKTRTKDRLGDLFSRMFILPVTSESVLSLPAPPGHRTGVSRTWGWGQGT